MRHRPAAVNLLAVLLLALTGIVTPVAAAEPANLSDQLSDDVGVLSGGDADRVLDAMGRLQEDTGTQLWVWLTDTTGGLSAPDFAAQTAELSSFGGTDLLLVVALEDRSYGYSVPDAFPLSDAQIERILSDELEPGLREEDYDGALVAVSDALRESIGGGGDSGGGGFDLGNLLLIVIVLGVIGAAVWWFFLRGRSAGGTATAGGPAGEPAAGSPDAIAAMSDEELEAEAARLLIATDDAIRDSEQELGFGQARFGEAEAKPFADAIAAAKQEISAAFRLRQQLDDSTPEDAATRRRMLGEIVAGCQRALDRLDDETERFEGLADFETEAPKLIDGAAAAVAAVEARFPQAEAAMERLRPYAKASWQPVVTNLEDARARLATATEAAAQGAAARTAGDTPKVVAAARVVQGALAQAGGLLDAVTDLADALDEARQKVGAEIAAAEADLARATAELDAGSDPALSSRLGEASALLAQARTAIEEPEPDVRGGYENAKQANAIADEVLAGIRSAEEQQAAQSARLEAAIRGAQATLTRAEEFISLRRGGVGREARTRLSEAERRLEKAVALGATDPAAAVEEAERASRLADEALALADRDDARTNDPWSMGAPGMPGGGGGGGGGIDGTSVLIGTILGGLFGGGGGGGGGGSPFGGLGGFGGGGRGGGRGGGLGGWGGGGGGGRRSGGGGGGGGGRRSGGGRW